MAGRKAPRPLPRPVRWLAMFLALVFVVSLGMVVNHESSKATGGASDASSSTPAKSPKRKKTAKTGGYGVWMYTVGGVLLLGAAAFIVIRSRKHKNER